MHQGKLPASWFSLSYVGKQKESFQLQDLEKDAEAQIAKITHLWGGDGGMSLVRRAIWGASTTTSLKHSWIIPIHLELFPWIFNLPHQI